MSIKGVAAIIAPGDQVRRGNDHSVLVTDEDGSEDQAKQDLMMKFARTVLGDVFTCLNDTDAWNIWQIAEKNGFKIKIFNSLPINLEPPSKRLVDTL